jgi:hypothetical protein
MSWLYSVREIQHQTSVESSLNRRGSAAQEDSDKDLDLRLRVDQTTSYHGPGYKHPDDRQDNHLHGTDR